VGTQEQPGVSVVEKQTVYKDFFINRPAKSLWVWTEGSLSTKGAMWLQVTYAEGAQKGNGPIGEAIDASKEQTKRK
jgi:hypothetical protein